MPAYHGLRPDNHQGRPPLPPKPGQCSPKESIGGRQLGTLDRSLKNRELLAQSKHLQLQGRSATDGVPR
jgi:hypothetical protein